MKTFKEYLEQIKYDKTIKHPDNSISKHKTGIGGLMHTLYTSPNAKFTAKELQQEFFKGTK